MSLRGAKRRSNLDFRAFEIATAFQASQRQEFTKVIRIGTKRDMSQMKLYPATLWKWFYDLQTTVIVEKRPDYALSTCLKAASNTVMVVL
ncbi:MAG: hypothetical protein JXB29_10300 [Sedimentisphaerales bacterium]|nr:hypothetical protein [Sedimentisphaerales bacterium]